MEGFLVRCYIRFESFPVYEGIKTPCLASCTNSALCLKVSLFTKGLRPCTEHSVVSQGMFESFPVYEGIKTV